MGNFLDRMKESSAVKIGLGSLAGAGLLAGYTAWKGDDDHAQSEADQTLNNVLDDHALQASMKNHAMDFNTYEQLHHGVQDIKDVGTMDLIKDTADIVRSPANYHDNQQIQTIKDLLRGDRVSSEFNTANGDLTVNGFKINAERNAEDGFKDYTAHLNKSVQGLSDQEKMKEIGGRLDVAHDYKNAVEKIKNTGHEFMKDRAIAGGVAGAGLGYFAHRHAQKNKPNMNQYQD